MAGRTELPVFSCCGDLAQQHFIDIALYILKCLTALFRILLYFLENLFNDIDRFDQQGRLRHNKYGISHVFRKRRTPPFNSLRNGNTFVWT